MRSILDAAGRLFYERGVHEVGMDEVIAAVGCGKATLYRLFPSKDALIEAYLRDRGEMILAAIDDDIATHADEPRTAIRAVINACAADVARPDFRGCAFNNASIEFPDPAHPARAVARWYRQELRRRMTALAGRLPTSDGSGRVRIGDALCLVIDGMYTSGAHLGAGGPAAQAPALVDWLLLANDKKTVVT